MTELDPRLSPGLRRWFDIDFTMFSIPHKARENMILTINLAFSEGISAGIDLGAAAMQAGIARGTRATVARLGDLTDEEIARDHTGVRPCDETASRED